MPGAIVGKVIKPGRFNDQAFAQKLEAKARQSGTVIKADFEATTKTWKHQVVFEMLLAFPPPRIEVMVATDDEIYTWVVEGTGAKAREGGGSEYEIWAGAYTGKSDKTMLFFSSQFVPKTQPGIIGSNSGFVGERDTLVPMVVHPGIEPRNFDRIIQKKREPWFKRQMEQAMAEARQASGHAA